MADAHRLLERRSALAAVQDAFAAAEAGATTVLGITAESGLGKSMLLAEAGRRAQARGLRIRTSACHPDQRSRPYRLAADLLEIGAGGLLSGSAAAVCTRARTALRRDTTAGPLVLLIDDAQWADRGSLDLLAWLARNAEDSSLAVVLAYGPRPTLASATVSELVADQRATEIALAPLSPDAARAMVTRTTAADPDSEYLRWALNAAAGNPFTLEVLAGLACEVDDATSDGSPDDAALTRRFAALPSSARRAAQAAAVLGAQFRMRLVAPVAGLTDADAADAIDVLHHARLIRQAGSGRCRFTHAALAQAVTADLGLGRRTELHTRAFDVLYEAGDLTGAAHHAAAADLVGQVKAITAVRVAAGRAETAMAAVDWYRALIDLHAGPAPVEDHAGLAAALLAADRPHEGVAACRAALADHGDRREATIELLGVLGRALSFAGTFDEARRTLDTALALAQRDASPLVPALLAERLHIAWQRDGPAVTAAMLDDLPGYNDWRDEHPALRAVGWLVTLWRGDDTRVAVDELLAAIDDVRAEGTARAMPFDPLLVSISAARCVERFDDELCLLDRATRRAADGRDRQAIVTLAVSRADHLVRVGRPADALNVLNLLDEAGTSGAGVPLMAPSPLLGAAFALAELGRTAEATIRLDALDEESLDWMDRLWLTHLRSRVAAADGHSAQASDWSLAAERLAAQLGVGSPMLCPWAGTAVESHLAAQRHDDVARICEWLEERATGEATWPRLVAGGGRAAIAAAAGDLEQAALLVDRAIALNCPVRLDHARVLILQGAVRRRLGQHRQARGPLAEALGITEGAGSALLAARSLAALRTAGGRRAADPTADRDALTPQEQRVARFAARSLTTSEIAQELVITAKTVETHLTRIYRKLGIQSKRELRDRELP
jgi:DNA-binding CsgD family transcriptional regulator